MVIGTHGMRHQRWTDLDDKGLQEELVYARTRLEQISGRFITEAACPFGSYNRRVLTALREQGYNSV
jgi:peptidoglycan/xylan/chitin deacetylase (PgdA/CDA1 family)